MSESKHSPRHSLNVSRFIRTAVNLCLLVASLLLLEGVSFVIFEVSKLERYRPPVVNNPYHPYLGWIHAPNITIHARNCGGPRNAKR